MSSSELPARINVFRSAEEADSGNGKVLVVETSLERTLQSASAKLGEEVVALRTSQGATMDDVSLLRDWDVVIIVTKADSACLMPVHKPNGVARLSSPPSPPSSASPDLLPSPSLPPPPPAVVAKKLSDPTNFELRRTSIFPPEDAASRRDWVRINLGGKVFATTRATLTSDPTSMLARMFESGWCSATDASGAYLIDRSPEYFEPLLNFLRHGKLILNEGINPQGVLEEAKFFGISKAIDPLERLVQTEELASSGHITRKEFLRMLAITSSSANLRCQGIDLEGVNLSNLDLRNINFKCANLHRCNLSSCDLTNCVFERADVSFANLEDAIVQCVHMPRVNLEGASLKGCSMDARLGRNTNLEGANLKGAQCDNCQMNGVNFRLASLKGAFFRSCNLRYAVMAGTDLENCDLLGSDLQHANLRGANIQGTNLKDVVI